MTQNQDPEVVTPDETDEEREEREERERDAAIAQQEVQQAGQGDEEGQGEPEGDDQATGTRLYDYGAMTGTVDTTDVGAGAWAFLETSSVVEFNTTPGEIDGGDEDDDGGSPIFRSEEETLELVEAEEEKRAEEHDNEMARREAAEEAEQAAIEAREEAIEEEQVVTTEEPPASGVEDEFTDEPVDEEPADEESDEDDGLFHPADHNVPEVQEYLDSADESERERVIAEENEREPQGRIGVLDYEPKG